MLERVLGLKNQRFPDLHNFDYRNFITKISRIYIALTLLVSITAETIIKSRKRIRYKRSFARRDGQAEYYQVRYSLASEDAKNREFGHSSCFQATIQNTGCL